MSYQIWFYLEMNFCSSFLNFFSNSRIISCFFSSSFLIRSLNPWLMFLIYWSINLANSSLTYSIKFSFSKINLLVLFNILSKSEMFWSKEPAISSICIKWCPLWSSYIHRTQTLEEQLLQKYSTGLPACLGHSIVSSSLPISSYFSFH